MVKVYGWLLLLSNAKKRLAVMLTSFFNFSSYYADKDRTQVRRYIFNFENCSKRRSRCWRGERRGVFNLIYFIFIYYNIIHNIIIYKVDFACSSLPLDFTKCTCVPAFAPPCKNRCLEWYGRICWIVYEILPKISELSHRLFLDIIGIADLETFCARRFSLHFNI